MRLHLTPPSLLHLITAILLTPQPHRLALANPRPAASLQAGFTYNELFARYDCSGELCGWNNQLCCQAGSACYTNALDQATCTGASASSTPQVGGSGNGHWNYWTSIYTITESEVVTSVYSSYVAGSSYVASAQPSQSASVHCNYALNESPCGNICCKSTQYCKSVSNGYGQCAAAAGQETTTTVAVPAGGSATPGAPLRPTSSGVVYITSTKSPTATVPFETPVATGANVTMINEGHHSSGLSGGAIAGIVIGVLLGLALLFLICFYCCLKGLLDGCLALFGLGGRRRRNTRVTEVEEYERRSHHDSRGGDRTWYGARKGPRRVERRESHTARNWAAGAAGLAGLWAILGLKRKRQERRRREEEKYTEYSYDSGYDYTSASSESSRDVQERRYVERSRSRRG